MKMSIEGAAAITGNSGLKRFNLNGATMGTRYSAVFYCPDDIDIVVLDAALFAAVDTVDRRMSSWKPQSGLSRLNAAPVGEWFAVEDDLFTVLEASLSVSRSSNGAFDIAVGDLVNAWGFGPAGTGPDADRIAGLKARSNVSALDGLDLDRTGSRVRKVAPLMLDLSGIAKGFGVDRLAKVMADHSVPAWLVGIDGEMRASGTKPQNQPWTVAVEKPVPGVREAMGVIELVDMAVATSGDYRHFFEFGGKMTSHTMNPQIAAPLDNKLASVSVISATCMQADAWATALMVMGEVDGPKTAQTLGLNALFVVRDGEKLHEIPIGSYFGSLT